jgi:hypothetical protein
MTKSDLVSVMDILKSASGREDIFGSPESLSYEAERLLKKFEKVK